MSDGLQLTLGCDLAEVGVLGRELSNYAVAQRLSADVRFALNLALEEVVTNVITHGYRGREPGPIRVAVWLEGDEAVASVEDKAPPFNPLLLPEPDVAVPLAERREGGLGVLLTRKLLDGIEYARVGDWNRLVMRKRRLPADGTAR